MIFDVDDDDDYYYCDDCFAAAVVDVRAPSVVVEKHSDPRGMLPNDAIASILGSKNPFRPLSEDDEDVFDLDYPWYHNL